MENILKSKNYARGSIATTVSKFRIQESEDWKIGNKIRKYEGEYEEEIDNEAY